MQNLLKYSGNYTVRVVKIQETQGGIPSEFTRFFEKRDIFSPANAVVQSFENEDIKLTAKNILMLISNELDKHGNFSQFSPFYGFTADDGSLLIEWIFDDFRVGFNLEQDANKSSWYLVSKVSVGGINASGYLQGIDPQSLITWLVTFVATQVS